MHLKTILSVSLFSTYYEVHTTALHEKDTCIKGAVAYESIPSQNIAQLLNNKSLDYNFYTNM